VNKGNNKITEQRGTVGIATIQKMPTKPIIKSRINSTTVSSKAKMTVSGMGGYIFKTKVVSSFSEKSSALDKF
jgi:hypothetical protein